MAGFEKYNANQNTPSLTPTVGATAQPAAPSRTHGNESDLGAPKLKVSHDVGVAMEAE